MEARINRQPRPADLGETRRRFLLAREQSACHASTERYLFVRGMRNWRTPRDRAAARVNDLSAR
jgi:hypothetical protein